MTRFNPLLDKKKPATNQITASEEMEASLAPLSPISGKPMINAFCRSVPCWVDPVNRLILPHKKV